MAFRLICFFICFFIVESSYAQEKLKPFQEKALQEMLMSFPEESRAAMRPKLEDAVRNTDEAIINSMIQGFRASQLEAAKTEPHVPTQTVTVSPKTNSRDAAKAMAILDPILRKLWSANMQFDRALENKARLIQSQILRQRYESYGRPAPLKIMFQITNNQKTPPYLSLRQTVEASVPAASTYAFDPASFQTTFDPKKLNEEIDNAYSQFHDLATRMGQELQALQTRSNQAPAQKQSAATDIVNRYQQQANTINQQLGSKLDTIRPSISNQLQTAFQKLK